MTVTQFDTGSGSPTAVPVPFNLEALGDGSFIPVSKLWFGALGSIGVPVSSTDPLPVTGTITTITPGTGATSLGKAEDAAHSSGDVGVFMLGVRRDTPTVSTSANGDYSGFSVDRLGRIQVADPLSGAGTVDTFGHLITGQRNNQIDIQFYRGTPASLLTVTTTGSGSATSSGGGAIFATGATATSSAKGVTSAITYYSSGGEIYAQFSAAFPTAGAASSFMRIGLFDDNNGIFLGYEGSSFGLTTRNATVDTSVASASFNLDTLTGAASSRFTRNGTPEAINLTFANVYRFRFGWLGEAPIIAEVLSPDGEWVPFHVIKQPNTTSAASFATPELPMTVHVSKTSGATNYSIVTYCWGAGCTIAQRKANDAITTSTIMPATRAVMAGETTAGGGTLVNVKVNPSGAVQMSLTENPVQLTAQFTRSSTVTAYAAGQVMSAGAVLSIANAVANAGDFLEIRDIMISSSVKGTPLPYFNIWILDSTYGAISDYTAVTLSDAENRTVEAVIPVNQQFSATNNGRVEAHGLSNLVKLTGTTLYFILEVTNAYTPGNGEVIDVMINARRVA